MIGAVDIGGSKIACGIVSAEGRVLAQTHFPTEPEHGPEAQAQRIVQALQAASAQANVTLQGIGIGCTGPVDPVRGTVEDVPFLPGWQGFDLCEALAGPLGVPATMENDADAAALGEYYFGSGRGAASFVLVTLGTGVGVGLVLNGTLYRGANGMHPEIGHMTISVDGPDCNCGKHGCWEAFIGGQALAEWMRQVPAIPQHWQVKDAFEAATQGEVRGARVVERFGEYLGLGIANLIMIFAPEVIALTGGVMRSRDLFWAHMRRTAAQNCAFVPFDGTRILPAMLDQDAGLVGAACAFLHRAR